MRQKPWSPSSSIKSLWLKCISAAVFRQKCKSFCQKQTEDAVFQEAGGGRCFCNLIYPKFLTPFLLKFEWKFHNLFTLEIWLKMDAAEAAPLRRLHFLICKVDGWLFRKLFQPCLHTRPRNEKVQEFCSKDFSGPKLIHGWADDKTWPLFAAAECKFALDTQQKQRQNELLMRSARKVCTSSLDISNII